MAIQASRLNDDKYLHWLRTSLSLLYLKEGIAPLCEEKSKEFHADIKGKVQLKNNFAATSTCSTCTCKDVQKRKPHGVLTWQIQCGSNICDEWLDEILQSHKDYPCGPCPNITWANSDPQLWPTDVWELSKLFQPYGCASQKSAADSDCQGLLSLMKNCTFFHTLLSDKAVLKQINDVRNACMHSSDLLVEEGDMRQALTLMRSLLEQPHLMNRPSCVEAKTKISQLRDNLLDISLNKELELQALNHKIAAVNSDVARLEAELQQLQTSLSDITTRQDTTSEEYRQMCEGVKELAQKIAEMKTNQEQHHQTIDARLGYLDAHTVGKMADLTSHLQELEKNSNKKIDRLESTIAKMETRLDDLTQRAPVQSAAGKKTSKKGPKKISKLRPDRKDDENWPIRARVDLYEHSATRTGYNVSYKGCPYFKCGLEDKSGDMIDAIAYRKFADSFKKHFQHDKVVNIKKATLIECDKQWRHIHNHAWTIRLDDDTEWNHGRKFQTAKSKDSSVRPLRRTRSMDTAPRTSTSTSSSMDMNQNAANGMDGDENKEKEEGLRDGAGVGDARTTVAPPSMANIGGQGSFNVFGGQVNIGPGSTILMNRSNTLSSSEMNPTASNGMYGDANDEKGKGSSRRDTIP